MPNRYVRESAIESERVNSLSWQGEVFFRRLINKVDDFGRLYASATLLRAALFPLQLDKVTEKDVVRLIAELEEKGLLATYEVDGKRFLALAKWEQGRAKKSKHPQPPDDICLRLQTYVYKCEEMSAHAPDSDTDSDSDSDSNSDNDNSSEEVKSEIETLRLRIGSWFKRRPTTKWSDRETRALKAVLKLNTPTEDIDALERWYLSGDPYLRRDPFTLLNNWNGEIDKARGKASTPQLFQRQTPNISKYTAEQIALMEAMG